MQKKKHTHKKKTKQNKKKHETHKEKTKKQRHTKLSVFPKARVSLGSEYQTLPLAISGVPKTW